ncbi:unnamed protein product, partial [Adineta steineri]
SWKTVECDIVVYATRVIQQTTEEALDIIYHNSNQMDMKNQESTQSINKVYV